MIATKPCPACHCERCGRPYTVAQPPQVPYPWTGPIWIVPTPFYVTPTPAADPPPWTYTITTDNTTNATPYTNLGTLTYTVA